jgi:hypothetical protein
LIDFRHIPFMIQLVGLEYHRWYTSFECKFT